MLSSRYHFFKCIIMYLRSTIFFVSLFLFSDVQAQSVIYSYTFEAGFEGWQNQTISNEGFWDWAANGKADQGTYWNSRPAIDDTQNGALVFDGDYMINNGVGSSTMDYSAAVRSPLLDFSAHPQVFIKFNQYYRNYLSATTLEISTNLGSTWQSISLNTGINRNVETDDKDYKILDISAYVANESDVYVRFLFSGQYYYWILDDISFHTEYPVIPSFPAIRAAQSRPGIRGFASPPSSQP